MDPLTQSLIGAVAAHAVLGRPRNEGGLGRLALAAGAMGGALPDLDVLLRPLADPALPFELHRHFTHSLVFIPVVGVLAALPLLVLPAARRSFAKILLAATLGAATHGLLDNLTSYGTHLLWPFVAHRTAWDSMSIVDPIFTGVLLLGVLVALVRGRARPARLALALCLAYIAFGFVQHDRAADAQQAIARTRGHAIERGRLVPTLGNVVVFRSIYRADGRLWADTLRVSPLGPVTMRAGTDVPAMTEADLPPNATAHARSAFNGLSQFAHGLLGAVEPEPDRGTDLIIADMRISTDTGGFRPLWGIRIDANGTANEWSNFPRSGTTARHELGRLVADLFEPGSQFQPIEDRRIVGPAPSSEDSP